MYAIVYCINLYMSTSAPPLTGTHFLASSDALGPSGINTLALPLAPPTELGEYSSSEDKICII